MPELSTQMWRDLDVASFLRPTSSRPSEFLDCKLEDYRAFTIAMMFALGPVAALMWGWDYVVDPIGAQSTIGLRLLCFAVGIVPAFLFLQVRRRDALQAITFVALLSAVAIFSAIITRLDGGYVYGIGGYMFYPIAVILVSRAFSAEFGISLAIAAGALPQLMGLTRLAPGFPQAQYAVLVWPAVGMTCVALLAMSYNYGKFYDARRQLELVSAIDPLTGAANRRLFMPLLEKEMARSKRYGHPLSLLMVDLDDLKLINDEHGHNVGDIVLRQLAEACRGTVRESDTLARLGGDEFAVLLPETDSQGAFDLAETVRAAVEASPALDPDGHFVRCTVSIGAAQARDTDTRDTSLIGRADEALYEAKQAGRNCVRGEQPQQAKLPVLEGLS